MKHYLYFSFLFLFACSNNEKAKSTGEQFPTKEKELQEAVKLYPDSALLVETLVQYYRETGNYNQAISSINTALVNDSTNARFWDIKATLHFEESDTLSAIKAFERSVYIFPQPDVIISLGVLYAQTSNPLALAMSDALLQANKAQAEKEAYFIKGLYHSSNGEKNKAISFFDKCLALNYGFMEAYREKAIALFDLGRYDESLEVLDKAIAIKNNFEEGHYFRGKVLEKLNRREDAADSYQRALLFDPEYIEAKDALSRLGIKQ